MIFHVTSDELWQAATKAGYYSHPSLEKEDFIHASYEQQLAGVIKRYYSNSTSLLLLCIDETKLASELKVEYSDSVGESFPHIYGTINLDAITEVKQIQANDYVE